MFKLNDMLVVSWNGVEVCVGRVTDLYDNGKDFKIKVTKVLPTNFLSSLCNAKGPCYMCLAIDSKVTSYKKIE